jgi:CysZ protein
MNEITQRDAGPALPRGMVKQFLKGLYYPLDAMLMLFREKLWRLALVPIVVNLFLMGLILAAILFWLGPYLNQLDVFLNTLSLGPYLTWFAGFLSSLLWVISAVISFLLSGVFVYLIGQAVASPFLDLLGERVEKIVLGAEEVPLGFRAMGRSVVMACSDLFWSIFVWVILHIPLLLIALLPLIGAPIWSTGSFVVSAFIVAVDFAGLPMARRLVPFRKRFFILWRLRWLSLGLGTALFVLLFIPGLNLLALPVAAIAGTLCYCDGRKAGVIAA